MSTTRRFFENQSPEQRQSELWEAMLNLIAAINANTEAQGGGGPSEPTMNIENLPYGAIVTPQASSDIVNIGTLTGAVTIANPTGTPVDGHTMIIRTQQDGTGGRLISFGADFKISLDAPLVSDFISDPDGTQEMEFRYHAGTDKWRLVALVKDFV